MDSLQWRNNPLGFGQKESRPAQIHIYNDPEEIKEMIEEVEEAPPLVKHIASIKTIVAIEMGISQLETLYEVVAFEIAYWLAETHRGVILSPTDYWHDHDKYRFKPIKK